MVCLSRPYYFRFFKGCSPQILLGAFLNALTHISLLLLKGYFKSIALPYRNTEETFQKALIFQILQCNDDDTASQTISLLLILSSCLVFHNLVN